MRRRLFLRVLLVTVLATPLISHAAPRPRSPQQIAQEHKRAAFRLFRNGKYAAGIERMRAAYDLVPHPGFLLNIAVAYHRWRGHCREALETLEAFQKACKNCRLKSAGQERKEEFTQACQVAVEVKTQPTGARLWLDGRPQGRSPAVLPLLPGRYTLVARLEDYHPAQEEIRVRRGTQPQVDLELVAIERPPVATQVTPPPPSPEPTPPVVSVEPEAQVTQLDDRDSYADPLFSGPWRWVALGVGAAATGVGIGFTVDAVNRVDEEESARISGASRDRVLDLRSSAETSAVLAHVGYGVGIVGIAVGLILVVLDPDHDGRLSDSSVSVSPSGAEARIRF